MIRLFNYNWELLAFKYLFNIIFILSVNLGYDINSFVYLVHNKFNILNLNNNNYTNLNI